MNWIITQEKFLNENELQNLIKVCKNDALLSKAKNNLIAQRDWLIIDVAINTGLRVQELCNLKVSDLFIGHGQNSLIVKNGKGNKQRVVVFNKSLKKHLSEYIKTYSPDDYLFQSSRGEKFTISAIQKIFKKKARKAKLPDRYSIHSLRHTYATRLYKASKYNLRMVQKQLGHSSIQTTTVYSDVMNQDISDALEKL